MYCVDEVYNDILFLQYKNLFYNMNDTWKIFLKKHQWIDKS
jgi:hypothetical protein